MVELRYSPAHGHDQNFCVSQVRGIEAVTSSKRAIVAELSKGLNGMKTGRLLRNARHTSRRVSLQGGWHSTPLIIDSFSTFNIFEISVRHSSKRLVQAQ